MSSFYRTWPILIALLAINVSIQAFQASRRLNSASKGNSLLRSAPSTSSTSLRLFNSLVTTPVAGKLRGSQVISLYFKYWNSREMDNAADLFDPDCIYEDTLYPEQFKGKDDIKFHLLRVADSLPSSFQFVVDEYSTGSDIKGQVTIGVQWHVESDGQQLPFTRGTSIYKVNDKGLISYGFDVPEPTVKQAPSVLQFSKMHQL